MLKTFKVNFLIMTQVKEIPELHSGATTYGMPGPKGGAGIHCLGVISFVF